MDRRLTYFVSDVHLGLDVKDPKAREARFVNFLSGLPQETDALYMLGDIWDFWYEYRDVVPKGYVRVFAAIAALIDRGVKVYFFQGNHDVWTYSYFEELGMVKLTQPHLVEIAGRKFCLGHGDGLGDVPLGYRFLRGVFHSPVLQAMFSALHPWIAFRLGNGWSRQNRLSHDVTYSFAGENEPLYRFAQDYASVNEVDCFIFGHYHDDVRMNIKAGTDFYILKDWMDGCSYICFDGEKVDVCVQAAMA